MSGYHITKVIVAAGVLLLPSAHAADAASAQQQQAGVAGNQGQGSAGAGTANGGVAAGGASAGRGAGSGDASLAGGTPDRAVAQPTAVTASAETAAATDSAGGVTAGAQTAGNAETGAQAAESTGARTQATGNAGLTLSGAAGEPYLESDEQEFDIKSRLMTASGDVLLRHGESSLKSDAMLFSQKEKLVVAEGDVVVSDGTFRFIAPYATYGYDSGELGAGDFRFGTYPLRVKGKGLSGTTGDLETTGITLYFNEPDPFALNMQAGSARLVNNEDLYLEDVVFRLGGIPFFYVPSYAVNLDKDAPISFSFRVGYNNSLGVFAQTQTLLRLGDGFRIGANLDGYTERGVLAGPAASWIKTFDDGSFIDTAFSSGYIHDEGNAKRLGFDMMGKPIDPNRYFIDWDLLAGVGKRIDVYGSLNWWSDSEVTRDFREDLFNHNQTPDNFFGTTYRGDQYLASGFVRFLPNSWTQSAQRLPELSFNLVPTEILETGIYQSLETSYAHLEEKDPYGVFSTMRSNRLNAYYNLSRTFAYDDWLTVTPVAGVMVTHYADTVQGAGQSNYTRVLGEVGIDMQMLMQGQWDVQNKTWGINGLRHQMRPVLQYRYIPSAQSGDTQIPQIDRQSAFQTYLDPIGLAGRRSIDQMYAASTLRIGLENVLQTRSDKDYGSRQLVALNVYQQFNFIREPARPAMYNDPAVPRQDTFSDFYTQLMVTPTDWLNMEVFTRIDPETFQLRQASTRTRVIDTDQWMAYVGNDYIEDTPGSMINQYVLGAGYRINDRNRLTFDMRIDGSLSEITEQYYGWQTRLGNSWLISTQVGYLQGSSRNDHFQFRIRADLQLF